MKRYSLFEFNRPWWGEFYFAGDVNDEKPLVLVPKPVYWLLHLWREIRIAYLGFRLDLRRNFKERTQ